MSEFVVYAKLSKEDIARAARTDDQTGIVIAQFIAEGVEGLRIARQIAENFLEAHFAGEWEDTHISMDNFVQYRIKFDFYGVAATIGIYDEHERAAEQEENK